MPTYQYSCTECGHFLEQFQSFSEDSLTECPSCGGKLRKVFNAVGVVFKGSGFYRNDSRASTASAEAGSGSSTNGSSEKATSDSGSKSDSGSSSDSSSTSKSNGDSGSKSDTTSSRKSDTKSSSGTPAAAS